MGHFYCVACHCWWIASSRELHFDNRREVGLTSQLRTYLLLGEPLRLPVLFHLRWQTGPVRGVRGVLTVLRMPKPLAE